LDGIYIGNKAFNTTSALTVKSAICSIIGTNGPDIIIYPDPTYEVFDIKNIGDESFQDLIYNISGVNLNVK
jgi:hypothetical protein